MRQLQSTYLAYLDYDSRARELEELVAEARTTNGSASVYLEARVEQFELRYEITSAELLERLSAGLQQETAEIAEWLFLLDALKTHAG